MLYLDESKCTRDRSKVAAVTAAGPELRHQVKSKPWRFRVECSSACKTERRYLPFTYDLEVVLDALVVDEVALTLLDDGHLDLLVEEGRRDLSSLLGDGSGIAAGEGGLSGRPQG